MKQLLLLTFTALFSIPSLAQTDTISISQAMRKSSTESQQVDDVTIYPVPVRENYLTIKCPKGIASVRVINIIGQQVFSEKFNEAPLSLKITLDNPERGIYIIDLRLPDRSRIVRKVLFEGAD
jgi:hypothetical protein